MPNHNHKPRWVMGQNPVAAVCDCGMRLLANGGGWVSPEEARKAQAALGVKGAL